MVGTVENDHGRFGVNGVAGPGTRAHFPPVGQNRAEIGDLPVELVRGVSIERDLTPVEVLSCLAPGRRQPWRLAIVHVGERHDGLRMLGESIGKLVQGESHVLKADLLSDDEKRHGGEASVKPPEHTGHHGAVAGPGVEHPQCRRFGSEFGKLCADALADRPLFAACGHEKQVLLSVVEEAEGTCAGRGVHQILTP